MLEALRRLTSRVALVFSTNILCLLFPIKFDKFSARTRDSKFSELRSYPVCYNGSSGDREWALLSDGDILLLLQGDGELFVNTSVSIDKSWKSPGSVPLAFLKSLSESSFGEILCSFFIPATLLLLANAIATFPSVFYLGVGPNV